MKMPARHRPFAAVLAIVVAAMVAALLAEPAGFAAGKQKPAAAKPATKAAVKAKTESKPSAEAAAPSGAAAENADQDQTKVKIERGAGGKKIYRIEGEIVIEGKIQKPEAFYVLQKSSINYDWHELKQDFVPKILESVTKPPF